MFNNIYKNRRVLVTGHTGFKGSWLCQWLLTLGAEIAGYSIDIPSLPAHFDILNLHNFIKHNQGDVRNIDTLRQVVNDFEPEIIFHLAAQPIVRSSYKDPKMTFETNLGGTVNMLEVLRNTPSIQAGVFITSDKCYENVEWEYGYREIDHLGGKDPYSASKACAELAFRAYTHSYFVDNPKVATARAGNVIGGGDWALDRIVPDCMRAWSQEKTLEIRSPQATRPWQHVLEPLSGYLWLGAQLFQDNTSTSGEAFNFGPSSDTIQPVSELTSGLAKFWTQGNAEITLSNMDTQYSESNLLKLNCDKALQRLQWQAVLSFDETVKMTAQWYNKFYMNAPDMSSYTTIQIREYVQTAKSRGCIWATS